MGFSTATKSNWLQRKVLKIIIIVVPNVVFLLLSIGDSDGMKDRSIYTLLLYTPPPYPEATEDIASSWALGMRASW